MVACDLYVKRLQRVDATAARVVVDRGSPLPFRAAFDRSPAGCTVVQARGRWLGIRRLSGD